MVSVAIRVVTAVVFSTILIAAVEPPEFEVIIGAVRSKAVEAVHSLPAILVNVPSVSLSVELLNIVPVSGSLNL